MIQACFHLAGDQIIVEVSGTNVMFLKSGEGLSPIDGLKLSYEGVIKQFPDLKDKDDWRKIAISRFKEHIKDLPSETTRIKYIIEDLIQHNYVCKYIQRQGNRPVNPEVFCN